MEALAAIGLASSIITFIDFGYELISVARDMHGSVTGHSKENTRIEFLNARMEDILADLSAKMSTPVTTEDEKRLGDLSSECLRLSRELKRLLGKLKVRDRHSKRQLIAYVLRDRWKKDEKKDLEKRLNSCRAQLHLQFSQTTWLQSMQRLDRIAESGKCQDVHLQQLKQQLLVLQTTLDQMSSGSVMLNDIELLLSRPKKALDKVLQNTVLEALRFEEMEKRFDYIEDAQVRTFGWLLDDSHVLLQSDSPTTISSSSPSSAISRYRTVLLLNKELPARLQARDRFIDWLKNGRGIFHISGKPGAGKSTLMKYMTGSPELQVHLKSWASSKKLVFASFFFWKHGTEYQRSFAGLVRSLLHSALSQCPELLSTVFPTQWKAAQDGITVRFDKAEISKAFETLMIQPQLYRDRKLAILIDGLDEFVGHEDSLLSALFDWVDSGLDNIKICVSSRELTIFQERFATCPKIRLHEITHSDILAFVEERLQNNKDANSPRYGLEEIIMLGRELVYDAEGVFLWASLAVGVLERGLLINDSIPRLRAKINSLPPDLEKLFEHIFRSIQTELHRDERQRAMQTLSIFVQKVRVNKVLRHFYHTVDESIDLLQLSFLDEYEEDPSFSQRVMGHLSDDELDRRLERCRKVVNSGCMGLVSVTSSDKTYISPSFSNTTPSTRFRTETALLTHRSLIEFFKRSNVRDEIQRYTQNFDFLEFSCQSLIAELKASASPWLEQFQVVKKAKDHLNFECAFTRRTLSLYDPQSAFLPPDTITNRDIYFTEPTFERDLIWLICIYYTGRPQSVSSLLSTFDEFVRIADSEIRPSDPLPCWKTLSHTFYWKPCYLTDTYLTQVNCLPSEYCRWTGIQLGINELWPVDDGVGTASFPPETMLHLVAGSIQILYWSPDSPFAREGRSCTDSKIIDRLIRTLTLALAKGASPNAKPHGQPFHLDGYAKNPDITQWQFLVWNSIMAGAELRMPLRALWLPFLIHDADTNIQLKFKRDEDLLRKCAGSDLEGPLLTMSAEFGMERRELFTPVVVAENHGGIVDLAQSQDGTVSLRDIVSFWFPEYAEDFRNVIDLNESRVGKPTAEELRCLRQKYGFDLDKWEAREWEIPQPLLKWSGQSIMHADTNNTLSTLPRAV